MNLKPALLFLSIFFASAGYSQLHYRDITFTDALQMAKQSGKIIFLQYESATCKECNEVADKGLGAKEVSEKIQSAFIPVKITSSSPERESIGKTYNVLKAFGSFFIDFNGNLLHSYHRSTTRWQEYADQINLALEKAGEALKLYDLEKTYKQFGGSAILEMVILKRESLDLPYDSELDKYVSILPEDSLHSGRTLKFIASRAPVLDSKADQMMRSDTMAFQKAWQELTLVERNRAAGKIIYKSMNEAITERNEPYAFKVSRFAVNNAKVTGANAERIRISNILHYYKGTGDTAKYVETAINYYKRYIMTIDVASIKRHDSLSYRSALDRAPFTDTVINGVHKQIKQVVQGPTYANYVASDLSNAANTLINMSSDPVIHATAYQWSKRALEFFESPGDLEIHSAICHKLGYEQEAAQADEKRAALRKKIFN